MSLKTQFRLDASRVISGWKSSNYSQTFYRKGSSFGCGGMQR